MGKNLIIKDSSGYMNKYPDILFEKISNFMTEFHLKGKTCYQISNSPLLRSNFYKTMDLDSLEVSKKAKEKSEKIYDDMTSNLHKSIRNNITDSFIRFVLGQTLYPIIREILSAKLLIAKIEPDLVVIESVNELSSFSCKAVDSVAEKNKIEKRIVEPNCFSFFKNRIYPLAWKKSWLEMLTDLKIFTLKQNDNNADKSILVHAPYINYFRSVEPVIKKLSDSNFSIYTTYSEPGNGWEKVRIDLDTSSESELKHVSKLIKSNWRDAKKRDNFKEIFNINDINFWPFIKRRLNFAFEYILPLSLNNQIMAEKLLDELNPNLLIIGTTPMTYKLGEILKVSRKREIPILQIQNGVVDPIKTPYFSPLTPDHIACGGLLWKDIYEQRGIPEEKISVTGWPKFDKYGRESYEKSNNLKSKYILFATQYIDFEMNKKVIEVIGESIEKTNLKLIVKPHPKERKKSYCILTDKINNAYTVNPTDSINKYVQKSDFVIIYNSTVGVEVLLNGKPMACVNLNDEYNYIIELYSEFGNCDVITNLKELKHWIRKIINSKLSFFECLGKKEIIKNFAYSNDGKASKRVVNLVHNIL